MTPDDWLYATGIRGAQNSTLAARRNPLLSIEAPAQPQYQIPLMRQTGSDFLSPGFGGDPERMPSGALPGVPDAGSGGGAAAPVTAAPAAPVAAAPVASSDNSNGSNSNGGTSAAAGGGLAGVLAGPLSNLAGRAVSSLLKPKDGGEKKPEAADQEGDLGGAPKDGGGASAIDAALPIAGGAVGGGLGGVFAGAPAASVPSGAVTVDALEPFVDGVSFPPISSGGGADAGAVSGLTDGADDIFSNGDLFGGSGSDFGAGDLGGIGGDLAPGTSAPPIDALADFGGGADTALGNAAGTASSTADAASKFGADAAAAGGWADPLGFTVDGLTINPSNIAGGIAGGWLGNKVADNGWETDPDDRWMRSVGSTVGGMVGSMIPIPFVGPAIGSFFGTIAGSAFEGQPDIPYSYAWGGGNYDWNNPDAAPTFSIGEAGSMNGGKPDVASSLGSRLNTDLNARAAAEGYVVNPEKVNQGGFYTGMWGGNNAGSQRQLFYQPSFGWDMGGQRGAVLADSRDMPDLLVDSYGELSDAIYGDLTTRGYFAKPGTTKSWSDVLTNLNSPEQNARWTTHASGDGEASGQWDAGDITTPANQRYYQPDGNVNAFTGEASWVGDKPNSFQAIEYEDGVNGGAARTAEAGAAGYWGSIDAGGDGATQQHFYEGSPYDTPAEQSNNSTAGMSQEMLDSMAYNATHQEPSSGREGGLIPPTPGGTQPVPNFTAHTGEFVVRPEAVQKYGPEMLTAINRGEAPAMPGAGGVDMVQGAENIAGQNTGPTFPSGIVPTTESTGGVQVQRDQDMGMGTVQRPPQLADQVQGMGQPTPDGSAAHEMAENPDMEAAEDAGGMSAWRHPYADEQRSTSPFAMATERAPLNEKVAKLPPPMQQSLIQSIGADPMAASAWLALLGPQGETLVRDALRAAGAMRQQAAMAQQQQMAPPGGQPMPGAPPAAI